MLPCSPLPQQGTSRACIAAVASPSPLAVTCRCSGACEKARGMKGEQHLSRGVAKVFVTDKLYWPSCPTTMLPLARPCICKLRLLDVYKLMACRLVQVYEQVASGSSGRPLDFGLWRSVFVSGMWCSASAAVARDPWFFKDTYARVRKSMAWTLSHMCARHIHVHSVYMCKATRDRTSVLFDMPVRRCACTSVGVL